MTSTDRRLAAALVLAMTTFAAPALAQQKSAADIETARELYNSGKALKEQGDLKGALEKLRAAHALGHTPITGVELARTHAALGQPVEAREVCLGIARTPVAPEETSRSAEARTDCAKLAEDVKPKIATLRVRIEGVPAGSAASLVIDGVAVPAEAIGQPRQADPGAHTIVVRIGNGPESKASVELKEAETRDVVLKVVAPKEPPPPRGEAHPPPRTEQRMSPLVIPGFAVAVVGVGVGTVTGVIAISTKNELANLCPGSHCGPDQHDELDRGKLMGNVSTVAFIVGALGAAVGIYGLTHPVSATPKSGGAAPYLGLGSAGVHGSF